LAAFAPILDTYGMTEEAFPAASPNTPASTSLELSSSSHEDSSPPIRNGTSAPGNSANSSDSDSTNRAILIAALFCASGVLLGTAFLIYQCRRHCCKDTSSSTRGGRPRMPHVAEASQCSELEASTPEKDRSIEIWRTETLGAAAAKNGVLSPIPQPVIPHEHDA
jgi:hypothetical protein